jgi:argininosuccinate synthase
MLQDELMPKYAELLYNGFWYSPERLALQAAIDKTQEFVTGTVRLKLYKVCGAANQLARHTLVVHPGDVHQRRSGNRLRLQRLQVSALSLACSLQGNVIVVGRKSPYSLYNQQLSSFEDDAGAYDQTDAAGFIKLQALRCVAHCAAHVIKLGNVSRQSCCVAAAD